MIFLVHKNCIKSVKWLMFFFILFCASTGCTEKDMREVEIDNSALYTALKSKLNDNNIYYKEKDKYILVVYNDDYDSILEIYNNVVEEVLPPNRSATFPLVIYKNIRSELDANGYKYIVICIKGVEWLVWNKNDSKNINAIIDDVTNLTLTKVTNEAALSNKRVDLSVMPNCEDQ